MLLRQANISLRVPVMGRVTTTTQIIMVLRIPKGRVTHIHRLWIIRTATVIARMCNQIPVRWLLEVGCSRKRSLGTVNLTRNHPQSALDSLNSVPLQERASPTLKVVQYLPVLGIGVTQSHRGMEPTVLTQMILKPLLRYPLYTLHPGSY